MDAKQIETSSGEQVYSYSWVLDPFSASETVRATLSGITEGTLTEAIELCKDLGVAVELYSDGAKCGRVSQDGNWRFF